MTKFSYKKYFDLITECSLAVRDSKEYRRALGILERCHADGGRVFTIGCGGSASTATHFAADLAKTTSAENGFKAISLVDNIPLVSAWTNDFGWDSVFEGQLKTWDVTSDDVLVGFSVHGGTEEWSKNISNAIKFMNKKGASTIGFSGFDGGVMKEMSDVCFVVPTSSEVYGTPLVEAMHVVINHGIVFDLKERVEK